MWELPETQRARWQETYQGIDVDLELKKAAVWLDANPSRRKTARGMPRFLVAWLNRVVTAPVRAGWRCHHDPPCHVNTTPYNCDLRTRMGR